MTVPAEFRCQTSREFNNAAFLHDHHQGKRSGRIFFQAIDASFDSRHCLGYRVLCHLLFCIHKSYAFWMYLFITRLIVTHGTGNWHAMFTVVPIHWAWMPFSSVIARQICNVPVLVSFFNSILSRSARKQRRIQGTT